MLNPSHNHTLRTIASCREQKRSCWAFLASDVYTAAVVREEPPDLPGVCKLLISGGILHGESGW